MATKFLSPEAQYRAGVNMREEPETADDAPVPAVSVGTEPPPVVRRGGSLDPPVAPASTTASAEPKPKKSEFAAMRNQEDAPPCSTCGSIMIRSGSCYKCANCGTTSGCA
jgi:ribonucleoside-diphosphate reductase alpha chain